MLRAYSTLPYCHIYPSFHVCVIASVIYITGVINSCSRTNKFGSKWGGTVLYIYTFFFVFTPNTSPRLNSCLHLLVSDFPPLSTFVCCWLGWREIFRDKSSRKKSVTEHKQSSKHNRIPICCEWNTEKREGKIITKFNFLPSLQAE